MLSPIIAPAAAQAIIMGSCKCPSVPAENEASKTMISPGRGMPALSMRIKSVTAGYPMTCNACCNACSEKIEEKLIIYLQEDKKFCYVNCKLVNTMEQYLVLCNHQSNPT